VFLCGFAMNPDYRLKDNTRNITSGKPFSQLKIRGSAMQCGGSDELQQQ